LFRVERDIRSVDNTSQACVTPPAEGATGYQQAAGTASSVNPGLAACVQRWEPQRRENSVNRNWPKIMLMSAATSAWLIYDISTATEAPRQAVAMLQYALLAGALIGLVGSLVMYAAQK
jgi:hypothetical protein